MRIVIPLIAALCSALAVAAQSESQQPVFRSGAGTVPVYVTVSDAEGKLVPDLERDDFEIYDNGKRQNDHALRQRHPADHGRHDARSQRQHEPATSSSCEQAAEAFVEQLLPADKARIGSFSNRIQVDPREFTSDKRRAAARSSGPSCRRTGPTPLWNAVNVGDHGAPAPGGPPRRPRVHRRRRQADELQQHNVAQGRDEARRGGGRHGVRDRPPEPHRFPDARQGSWTGPSVGAIGTPGGGSRQPPEFEKPDEGLPKIAAGAPAAATSS